MRLFISYAHVDRPLVKAWVVDNLTAGGHTVWFDERLTAGQNWQEQLLAEIQQSDALVYCMTPESVASEWCQWELARAVEAGKPVIPVLLQDKTDIPEALQSLQYVDFSNGPTGDSVARLMGGLQRLAEVPDAPTNPQGSPQGVDEYDYQQRKLEAAMPACTKLDRETKLKVKISLPNSPGLRAELPEVLPSGDVIMQDDVRPTNFRMRFPVETGQITLGDVCIQIKSEQFAISAIDAEPGPCQSDQYYLMVPPREDSRTLNFILQPKDTQQTGLETVYVVVYQDQDLVVATYVETQLVQTLDQNPICGNWRLQLAMVKWAAGSSALPPSHAPAPQTSEVVLERSVLESDIRMEPSRSETKNKLTIWRIVGAASAVILFFVAIFGVLPDETRDGFFVSIGLIDPTAQATPTTPRITALSNLDIRDGPETGFDRIAVLNAGDYLDILGISQDDRWYQVLLPDGNTGWVVAASSAGEVSGPIGALAVIVPTNTPTSTPTQAPTATDLPAVIEPSTDLPDPTATSTSPPEFVTTSTTSVVGYPCEAQVRVPSGSYATVVNEVRLRPSSGSRLSASPANPLSVGQTISIVDKDELNTSEDWYQIHDVDGNYLGWIQSQHLILSNTCPQ